MDRNSILSMLIEKETGRKFAGAPIWEEIERAVANACEDEGEGWLTGQDDVLMKWDYDVNYKRTYNEENDCWETEIHLLNVKIEDKQTHESWLVQVEGADL